MYYKDKTTDVYTLVINFPKEYAKDTTYENYIERRCRKPWLQGRRG